MSSILKKIILKNDLVSLDGGSAKASKDFINIDGWYNFEHEVNNIGDLLSYVIVEEIASRYYGIDIKKDKTKKRKQHLYSAGSVLLGWQDQTVWGSGFLRDISKSNSFNYLRLLHKLCHKTDVRAVRGPFTKNVLTKMGIKCPDVFGDPALLLPLVYPHKHENSCKNSDYVVIPHYTQDRLFENNANLLYIFVNDYKPFIDKMCSANLVVSSSLHGIILAEAYGIPAVFLRNSIEKGMFKYYDYYGSTGRDNFPIVDTLEEALTVTPSIPENGIISELQEGLIKSFPNDLW